jgi:hypothetical protein
MSLGGMSGGWGGLKFFGTSRDYHKSAVKFSKFFDHSPPLKIFLNPYPPLKIFGQAHVPNFNLLSGNKLDLVPHLTSPHLTSTLLT